MKYENPQPMRREEAERIFASGTSHQVQDALVRVALHEPDWLWVQSQCLRFLRDSDVNIQIAAIQCLGHLARLHRTLDLELVEPILQSLKANPVLSGAVEDAFDDITTFIESREDIPPEHGTRWLFLVKLCALCVLCGKAVFSRLRIFGARLYNQHQTLILVRT